MSFRFLEYFSPFRNFSRNFYCEVCVLCFLTAMISGYTNTKLLCAQEKVYPVICFLSRSGETFPPLCTCDTLQKFFGSLYKSEKALPITHVFIKRKVLVFWKLSKEKYSKMQLYIYMFTIKLAFVFLMPSIFELTLSSNQLKSVFNNLFVIY